MMEVKVTSPIRILITSSDKKLVPNSFIIHAHPESTILRILQYTHFKIYEQIQAGTTNFMIVDTSGEDDQNDLFSLGHVSEYHLLYNGQSLRINTLLRDVNKSRTTSLIKLQLEKNDNKLQYLEKLHYNLHSEFNNVRLKLRVNVCSKMKLLEIFEDNISIKTTLHLLKLQVISYVKKYETSATGRDACGIRHKHNESDLTELRIKSQKNTIYLNESKHKHLYNDLTLPELLELDLSPSSNSYFVLEFKMIHGKNRYEENEYYTINFLTDVQLSTYKMQITEDTTVEDIKEYICTVYANSLRLYHRDIILYYDGLKLNPLNAVGNYSKIIEYIENPEGINIEVSIEQDFIESGPGFWSELFNSPYRFNFMHSGSYWEPHNEELGSSTSDIESSSNSDFSIENSQKIEYISENGTKIIRTNEYYMKCTINDTKEIYINEINLSNNNNKLHFEEANNGGSSIAINENNIKIGNQQIQLNEVFVDELSKSLKLFKKDKKSSIQTPDYFTSDSEEDEISLHKNRMNSRRKRIMETDGIRRQNKYIENLLIIFSILKSKFYRIYPFVIIASQSLIMICFNILFPLYIVYQTSIYFSQIISLLISLFLMFKIFLCGQEIKKIWQRYLKKMKILNPRNLRKIKIYIKEQNLHNHFYTNNKDNINIIDILLAPSLNLKRQQLFNSFKSTQTDPVEPANIDELKNLKLLFTKVDNKNYKTLLDQLYIEWLTIYQKQIESRLPEEITDFLLLITDEMNKSDIHT